MTYGDLMKVHQMPTSGTRIELSDWLRTSIKNADTFLSRDTFNHPWKVVQCPPSHRCLVSSPLRCEFWVRSPLLPATTVSPRFEPFNQSVFLHSQVASRPLYSKWKACCFEDGKPRLVHMAYLVTGAWSHSSTKSQQWHQSNLILLIICNE